MIDFSICVVIKIFVVSSLRFKVCKLLVTHTTDCLTKLSFYTLVDRVFEQLFGGHISLNIHRTTVGQLQEGIL